MSRKPTNAESFLQNMKREPREVPAALPIAVEPEARPARAASKTALVPKAPGRAGRKHIGGYLEDETVEKVALLRARLSLDNSQLITKAIDDLFAKEKAKRAFSG